MKVLLDTHTFIWWDDDRSKLSAQALTVLLDASNTVLLSVASAWELVIKMNLGKMALSAPLVDVLAQQQANGFQILPVALDHVLAVEALPALHKDPFDRLLIAQAIVEDIPIIGVDPTFDAYPVRRIW
jgi:PIN domain nuclease of toxin-antitoxin system